MEQADNDATFDRFPDLPSELRQQIFKHYFDSFDHSQILEAGGQPPITLASRHTRLEALPLYYSQYCFTLDAAYYSGRDWSRQAFISETQAHHFARIRSLMASGFRYRYHDAVYTIDISVSLNDAECSAKVLHISSDDDDGDTEVVANNVNRLLMQEPHAVVRRIASRAGWQKLRKTDMPELHYWLSSAVERACAT